MSEGYTTKKWILKTPFKGSPTRENYDIVEEKLPPIKDGEFLLEAEWVTVDPYQRVFPIEVGSLIHSGQVGRVIESKNADYAVGDHVYGYFGWATRSICNGSSEGHVFGLRKLDPSSSVSRSTALGVLGMPGATAHIGLLEVCKPKAGETLVVTAAAGAVGSLVGQIGKIKGLRVVGFAGSDEKVEYLKSIGFDAAYNYKKVSSLAEAIDEGCPNGVDTFFDNVGGEFFETVLSKMNSGGRVCVCGSISEYNLEQPATARPVSGLILWKELTVQGFLCIPALPRWPDSFKEMEQWIVEGKLKYKERVFEGFDKLFEAFSSLFSSGVNIGKVVVKI